MRSWRPVPPEKRPHGGDEEAEEDVPSDGLPVHAGRSGNPGDLDLDRPEPDTQSRTSPRPASPGPPPQGQEGPDHGSAVRLAARCYDDPVYNSACYYRYAEGLYVYTPVPSCLLRSPADPSSVCAPGGYMEYQGYDISANQALIPKLQRLLHAFRAAGFPVYHTREGKRWLEQYQ